MVVRGAEVDNGKIRIRYQQLLPSVIREDAHKLISSSMPLWVQVRVQQRENARYFARWECSCNMSEEGAHSSPSASSYQE